MVVFGPPLPSAPAAAESLALPDVARRPWFAGEVGFWAAHLAFWGLAWAASNLVVAVYRPKHAETAAILAARMVTLCLATAGMRWLSKRPWLLTRLNVTRAGLVGGGLLTAAVVITLMFAAVESFVGAPAAGFSRGRLVAHLAVNATLLANWCALYFGQQLLRERSSAEFRAVEAESLALKHELHRLQSQISPHFLFNALNTVLAHRDEPETIETVTQAFALYLRFLLRPAATFEPLAQELEALEHYLTVQAVRFGDTLETRIDCDLDVRDIMVPPVLVQPLVENALKYGGQTGERPLRLWIRARRDGDWLEVAVSNTGRWVPPGRPSTTGTGLKSLERRLRLLVGPEAGISHEEHDGWVHVRVRIPLAGTPAGSGPA